jgi:hypothetical protein
MVLHRPIESTAFIGRMDLLLSGGQRGSVSGHRKHATYARLFRGEYPVSRY